MSGRADSSPYERLAASSPVTTPEHRGSSHSEPGQQGGPGPHADSGGAYPGGVSMYTRGGI
jgi:hypothetical protein